MSQNPSRLRCTLAVRCRITKGPNNAEKKGPSLPSPCHRLSWSATLRVGWESGEPLGQAGQPGRGDQLKALDALLTERLPVADAIDAVAGEPRKFCGSGVPPSTVSSPAVEDDPMGTTATSGATSTASSERCWGRTCRALETSADTIAAQ